MTFVNYFTPIAEKLGYDVIQKASNDENELFKTCYVEYSSSPGSLYTSVVIRFVDLTTGLKIMETEGSYGMGWDYAGDLKGAIRAALYDAKYSGFSEVAFQRNISDRKKPLPKINLSEKQFKAMRLIHKIEGIWNDDEGHYRVAIMKDTSGVFGDFVGFVLSTDKTLWQAGEVKMKFMESSSSRFFIGKYTMGDKSDVNATFDLTNDVLLKISTKGTNGQNYDFSYLRMFPKFGESNTQPIPNETNVIATGTGFLISNDGMFVTNYHVIEGAREVKAYFPFLDKELIASVIMNDKINDISLLKINEFEEINFNIESLPYGFGKASDVKLGDEIYTIGYPIQDVLGTTPKYTTGVISSKNGLDNDPRCFQISAQIQPGSSGSPLFDQYGNIIGIVVATLNADYLYRSHNSLPQDVNYAIKYDYINNIIDMLPTRISTKSIVDKNADNVAKCIIIVRSSN